MYYILYIYVLYFIYLCITVRPTQRRYLSWKLKKKPLHDVCGPGSSVSIVTGYGLDGPGIETRWWRSFSHLSRPALGPTQACRMGTGSFPGVKSGRGVTLTFHPHLVSWSWKNRVIPLLHLWAVRPVHSLSACTWVHFTFTPWCIHCVVVAVFSAACERYVCVTSAVTLGGRVLVYFQRNCITQCSFTCVVSSGLLTMRATDNWVVPTEV